MKTHQYEFTGYQNYEEVQKKLEHDCRIALGTDNYPFYLAVNEAVLNAAAYHVDGPEKARIRITLSIFAFDINVTVSAHTRPFDAGRYRDELRKLLADKEIREMDWGDYTADSDKSRGFWYILSAVEYCTVDVDGQEITLAVPRPYNPEKRLSMRIKDLVPKFYVKTNGVIR